MTTAQSDKLAGFLSRDNVRRFKVEGSKSNPTQSNCNFREEIASYMTKPNALSYVEQFHRRGLWVEVFCEESKELLAGPFDPDQPLPRVFIGA